MMETREGERRSDAAENRASRVSSIAKGLIAVRKFVRSVAAPLVALVAVLVVASSAVAQTTIIDTLPNPSRDSFRSVDQNGIAAQRFITGDQDFSLFSFAARVSSPDLGAARVFLFDDAFDSANGVPVPGGFFSFLAGFRVNNPAPANFTVFVPRTFELRANTAYWFVMFAEAGTVDFYFSSRTTTTSVRGVGSIPPEFSTAFAPDFSRPWSNVEFGQPEVFNLHLNGFPLAGAVTVAAPEPAPFALMMLLAGGAVVASLPKVGGCVPTKVSRLASCLRLS
jgi:hypothetical protein